MGFNVMTVGNKATMKTRIVAKQNLFKRFKTRFASTKNPTERRFCKNEAVRLVRELKVLAKQWKKYGFGPIGWITRGYNVTSFNGTTTRRNYRKSTVRKNSRRTSRKSYARKTNRKSNVRKNKRSYAKRAGVKTWSSRKTRSNKARRSYSWR